MSNSFSWSGFTCLYCGQSFHNANKEISKAELIAHDQVCDKNPLVKRIKELEEAVQEALSIVKLKWNEVDNHPASRWVKDVEYFEKVLKGDK